MDKLRDVCLSILEDIDHVVLALPLFFLQTAAIVSYNSSHAKWHIQSGCLSWDYPATLNDTNTTVSQGGITESIVGST